MENYLSQFIPAMYDLSSNLRKLLKKDVLFQWTSSHENDSQELKDNISSDVCIQSLISSTQVDASKRVLI